MLSLCRASPPAPHCTATSPRPAPSRCLQAPRLMALSAAWCAAPSFCCQVGRPVLGTAHACQPFAWIVDRGASSEGGRPMRLEPTQGGRGAAWHAQEGGREGGGARIVDKKDARNRGERDERRHFFFLGKKTLKEPAPPRPAPARPGVSPAARDCRALGVRRCGRVFRQAAAAQRDLAAHAAVRHGGQGWAGGGGRGGGRAGGCGSLSGWAVLTKAPPRSTLFVKPPSLCTNCTLLQRLPAPVHRHNHGVLYLLCL